MGRTSLGQDRRARKAGGKAGRLPAGQRTGGCVGAACPLRLVCCKGLVRAVVIVDAAGQSREEGTAE